MASQITSLTIVYSVVYSDADQRNRQNSASLASNAEMVPFDDVIMFVTKQSNKEACVYFMGYILYSFILGCIVMGQQ